MNELEAAWIPAEAIIIPAVWLIATAVERLRARRRRITDRARVVSAFERAGAGELTRIARLLEEAEREEVQRAR